MMLRVCLVLGFVSVHFVTASPAEEKLFHHLLEHYGSSSRPVSHPNDTLTTKLSFDLVNLDNLDVDEGQMEVYGWIQMSWTDKQLTWNTSDHEGIKVLHMPVESIWTPDIKLYNGPGATQDNTLSLVYSDGTVLWVPPLTASVKCTFNPLWYPFDEQKCTLVFGSWTHDANEMDLQVGTLSVPEFRGSKEWKLISVNHERVAKKYDCCENLYPSINVTVTLRRKACKHVTEQVLPKISLVVVGLMTMMIPAARADIRLLVITLLFGPMILHMTIADVPQAVSALTVLNGQFMSVLIGLFLCNCIHLAMMRGNFDSSLLAKISGMVSTMSSEDKSENLISSIEHRYHKTLDTIFTIPLGFFTVAATALFITIPFFN